MTVLAGTPVELAAGLVQSVDWLAVAPPAIIAVAALALPRLLRPLFVAASVMGQVLGAINQRILLAAMFFLIVMPFGILQRFLLGRDAMGRAFATGASSYKVYCKGKNLSVNKERTF